MKRELLEKTIELRHELHRNAELSGKEEKTKAILMEAIARDTELEICDRGSWFYAFYDCGHQLAGSVAVRADMDALPMEDIEGLDYASDSPGVSHRCGHDGHSAVLYCLCRMVSELGSSNNVYFIFQHGEETGTGGRECAGLIEEKEISEVYAFHNWSGYPENSVVLRRGTAMCASEGLKIVVKGKPSHASQPEAGLNPSLALAETLVRSKELEEKKAAEGVMVTVVGISCGGSNFGMSPGEGELCLTLRALREKDMKDIEQEIVAFAEKLAEDAGMDMTAERHDVFPETRNDSKALAIVALAAESLGLETVEMVEPIRSSEDFGHYQKKCPGAMIFVGNGEDYPQIHTEEYDFNDGIIEKTVLLLYEILK